MGKTEGFQILQLFGPNVSEPRFNILDDVNFAGMAPKEFYLPTPNTQAIAEHYGISMPNWTEKIANLQHPTELEQSSPLELTVGWITTADVMAYRAGKIKVAPLVSVGLAITKDNYLLVGLRGGNLIPDMIEKYACGLYGTIPAGMTTWKQSENPVKETLRHEFQEEIGPFDYEMGKLIGIAQSTGRLPGRNFYMTIKTDATLAQVQEVNRRANEEYRNLKAKAATPPDIEAELKRLRLPVDAWESEPILGIPNDKDSITKVLEALPGSFIGPALGALNIYARTL